MPPQPNAAAAPQLRRSRIVITMIVGVLALLLAVPVCLLLFVAIRNFAFEGTSARVAQTRARASTGENMIKTYNLDYGCVPASLQALVPNYSQSVPFDGWRKSFGYVKNSDGSVLLISLGADGAFGGTGPDTDIWWHLSGSSTTEGTGQPPSPK